MHPLLYLIHRFAGYGDLVSGLSNCTQEILSLKAKNSHLQTENRCLQDEVTYHQEVLAVETSQGELSAPVPLTGQDGDNILTQIRGLLARSGLPVFRIVPQPPVWLVLLPAVATTGTTADVVVHSDGA